MPATNPEPDRGVVARRPLPFVSSAAEALVGCVVYDEAVREGEREAGCEDSAGWRVAPWPPLGGVRDAMADTEEYDCSALRTLTQPLSPWSPPLASGVRFRGRGHGRVIWPRKKPSRAHLRRWRSSSSRPVWPSSSWPELSLVACDPHVTASPKRVAAPGVDQSSAETGSGSLRRARVLSYVRVLVTRAP